MIVDFVDLTGLIFQMNKTIPEGAATSVFCCISPNIQGDNQLNSSLLTLNDDYNIYLSYIFI